MTTSLNRRTVIKWAGALPVFGTLPLGVLHTLRSVFPLTSSAGRVATFAPTALLYLLFSIPLLVFCRDHAPARERQRIPWRRAFQEVAGTLRDARRYPGTIRFLIASFVYQDAMGTIISYMALYAVVAMGFRRGAETTLFVVLTIPAVFGAWVWGRLTDRIGAKRTLLLVIGAWIVLLIAMIVAPSRGAFWVVGALIGFIYGGVNVAERPLLRPGPLGSLLGGVVWWRHRRGGRPRHVVDLFPEAESFELAPGEPLTNRRDVHDALLRWLA